MSNVKGPSSSYAMNGFCNRNFKVEQFVIKLPHEINRL